MSPEIEIMLIATVVATACVIPGTFLVLRGMALMSDAISHAILLGIVLMFFVVHSLGSPLLILGAALAGLLTVSITEVVISTKRVKEDAAIGLVFPVFFSIGVILISKFARDVHLDLDAVILGEIAFAPFNRFYYEHLDLGPISLWIMGTVLVINLLFLTFFYKELKLVTFDKGLAKTLGFSPILLNYILMSVTSITAVSAFDSVGSILVVALMITPPSAAFLMSTRLSHMIRWAMLFGVASALLGYVAANIINASISGSIATMNGLIFVIVLLFAPDRGLIAKALHFRMQQTNFSCDLLMVQLLSHEGTSSEEEESRISNMVDHMGWSQRFANRVVKFGVQHGYIERDQHHLKLLPLGRELAKDIMVKGPSKSIFKD